MKKLIAWVKKASRSNRVFRTAVQGFCSYMAINVPAIWDRGGDLAVALEALVAGAIAAGISAIWKTAAAELVTPEESEASMIERGL